jgi:hypothetical protein
MNSYPARNQRMRPITSARITTAAIATLHTRIAAQLRKSQRFDGSCSRGIDHQRALRGGFGCSLDRYI